MKTIRDAVHGDLRLSEDERRLIDTPTFQRLRGIKQLGTSSLVYPSATHTRFEHSLGTAWLVGRLLDGLERHGYVVPPEDATVARLAGLLHDVTHVPFGHTFEDERRLLEKHDRDPERLRYFFHESPLAEVLDKLDFGSRVRETLVADATVPSLIQDLVSGTVCADLLDYLRRDAFHCGLRLDYDERLFEYFSVQSGRLVVRLHKAGSLRHDVLSELIHLLQLRYTLTERVYFHHAKVSAGAMISRAVELAFHAQRMSPRDLYEIRDDTLIDRLAVLAEEVEGLGSLIDDLRAHRLYRRAYVLCAAAPRHPGLELSERQDLVTRYHRNRQHRAEVERELAARVGLPESEVIIYCPSERMQLKEADVPVEIAEGIVAPLSSLDHPDISALTSKHQAIWRFYVLVRRREDSVLPVVARHAEEIIGHRNQKEILTTFATERQRMSSP